MISVTRVQIGLYPVGRTATMKLNPALLIALLLASLSVLHAADLSL